jgi:hypothetical protein
MAACKDAQWGEKNFPLICNNRYSVTYTEDNGTPEGNTVTKTLTFAGLTETKTRVGGLIDTLTMTYWHDTDGKDGNEISINPVHIDNIVNYTTGGRRTRRKTKRNRRTRSRK